MVLPSVLLPHFLRNKMDRKQTAISFVFASQPIKKFQPSKLIYSVTRLKAIGVGAAGAGRGGEKMMELQE